jgi:Sigma-54 interaction domain
VGALQERARGAFTDAMRERPRLFEAASGGALFLGEVEELPLAMQAKLLRTLQEQQVRRVSENRVRPIRVRVVAATNRELDREVKAGHFPRTPLLPAARRGVPRLPAARARGGHPAAGARAARRRGGAHGPADAHAPPRAADQILRYPQESVGAIQRPTTEWGSLAKPILLLVGRSPFFPLPEHTPSRATHGGSESARPPLYRKLKR